MNNYLLIPGLISMIRLLRSHTCLVCSVFEITIAMNQDPKMDYLFAPMLNRLGIGDLRYKQILFIRPMNQKF